MIWTAVSGCILEILGYVSFATIYILFTPPDSLIPIEYRSEKLEWSFVVEQKRLRSNSLHHPGRSAFKHHSSRSRADTDPHMNNMFYFGKLFQLRSCESHCHGRSSVRSIA